MELILAEKPSAARNFAKALGGKTGNYAGTEYKITNLRGHVMGLLPPINRFLLKRSSSIRVGILKICRGISTILHGRRGS